MRADRRACSLGVFFVVVFLSGRPVVGASFIRGDADANGQIDITDGIRILGYLFLGNPAALDCEEASDADASRLIDISDAVYLLSFLFTGGAAPPAPFPTCGPSPGGLGCAAYPDCDRPTSFELINRALEAGEITTETALIYRVFHVFEDERLPGAFRGAAGGLVDTHLIAEVLERYGELSEDGRAVLDPFLLPPSAEGSWLEQRQLAGGGAIEWQTVVSPSGKVKVWSQSRYAGDSQTAATIAGAVDGIWDKLSGLMKREPLPDGEVGESNGGDPKFDIYLVHLQSALGETNEYRTGYTCAQPRPAYVLIDTREQFCLLTTVAHELMHAIQFS